MKQSCARSTHSSFISRTTTGNRGLGDAKFEKHRVRFLLRDERTLKVGRNFNVVEFRANWHLKPSVGSEKGWVWLAARWSDGEPKHVRLAWELDTKELALRFNVALEDAEVLNKPALGIG